MGITGGMSRKRAIYYLAASLFFCAANAAWAQTAPDTKNEIAYRAGLGRGDDVKLLIQQGANPNSKNEQGVPILLVAADRKDVQALPVVQALLEGGADVNAKDAQGQTALYYAARTGNAAVVDYLLKHKIDYYSIDRNGDIARTIAFRAGHTDIVELMDNYVKSQTLQLQNAYKTVELTPEQQQEQLAKQQAEEREQAAREEELARMQQERKLQQYKENLKKLDGMVADISYNACAFQYWSFAQAANQTTVLSDEEMDETIEIHRQAVREAGLEVMKMFNVRTNYVNKIINPSKQLIFNQLNSMPSRTYRKENGVGTLEDVKQRCDKIASSWVISEPKAQKNNGIRRKQEANKKKNSAKTYPGQVQIQKMGGQKQQRQ